MSNWLNKHVTLKISYELIVVNSRIARTYCKGEKRNDTKRCLNTLLC
uniref:Uncharacterized protein n=1 Tax=Arundo donax TaxID=35708 RepID=A0A0A9F9Z2_ARUDO